MTSKTTRYGIPTMFAALVAFGVASEYIRKPIDFTDTLRGFSCEKADGNYPLQFKSNYVVNASLEDSAKNYLRTGLKYHVTGYQNLWGKKAKTIEKVLD